MFRLTSAGHSGLQIQLFGLFRFQVIGARVFRNIGSVWVMSGLDGILFFFIKSGT